MRRIATRSVVGVGCAVTLLSAALVGLAPAQAASGDPVAAQPARIHWANGKPVAGKSAPAPGQVVKPYLSGHGVGAAAGSLSAVGSWKAHGLSVVRLGHTLGGLRVPA